MCGIAGVARLDAEPDVLRLLLGRMCAAIGHRGPDGGGVAIHADASIGMTRLAIVDVEHGHQPMFGDGGDVALVFNGEIYNAPELRGLLEKDGVRFRTRSDTEVVLRLYERDPDRVEERLRGMWALAVHDRRRRRLVLSRDRFGIKPLYVVARGGVVAFASELGALRALEARPELAGAFALDAGAAHAMLAWSYVPGEACIFAGVRKLAPASRLEIDLATGASTTRVYYTLRPSAEAASVRSLRDACALVEPALRASVKEHLESDVPIAAFMSGGVDSSLVAAYAADASSRPIAGFSIGFREPRFDESPFARETAERLGLPLEVTVLDEGAARASLADALLAYDEPFGDSSSLATFLLSSVVGRRHKVALGGDGGDEIFAGYRKHRAVPLREAFSVLPSLRDALARALAKLPARADRTSLVSETLRTTRRLARSLAGGDAAAYVALTQVASFAATAPLVRAPADPERFERPMLAAFERAGGSQLRRTLACDLAFVLPGDMLAKVDRASMACHLEARVPMLDHRVVEIGVGLPAEFTLGDKGKRVLRALHEDRFGRALARRKKQGFCVPVEAWLRGPLRRTCERLFSRERVARDGVFAEGFAEDWPAWVDRNPLLVWHAFALAVWCEAALGGGPEAVRRLVAG